MEIKWHTCIIPNTSFFTEPPTVVFGFQTLTKLPARPTYFVASSDLFMSLATCEMAKSPKAYYTNQII